MNLNREQKKFAYGKYEFYDQIKSILDFMDPVSKLDVKIEEVKSSSGPVEFWIFILLAIVVTIVHFARFFIAEKFNIYPATVDKTVIPTIIGCFVLYFVIYGINYWTHITRDVDNDLNNFIIPFLQKIEKYVGKENRIKLTTNLSSKLSKKNKTDTGSYADSLVLPWFNAELPFDNGIKVIVDLTYVINCYGKLEVIRNAGAFKDLLIKSEFKFIFPKRPTFQKFEYIGANYILDWKETEKDYFLTIKTVEKCDVEFYRDADKTLGLIFDNNFCNDIIDDIYARITGFTGYLIFDTTNTDEEVSDSDYEELEKLKETNENFYKSQYDNMQEPKQNLESEIVSEDNLPVPVTSKTNNSSEIINPGSTN